MQFRRLVFSQPFPGSADSLAQAFAQEGAATPVACTLAIFPVEPGVARVNLASIGAAKAWSFTRSVQSQGLDASAYRKRRVLTDNPQALAQAFLEASDLRIALDGSGPSLLALDSLSVKLTDERVTGCTVSADPTHWALDTDLRLDVRMQDYERVLRTLRGPGRNVRSDMKADLVMHGPLPLDLEDRKRCFVRVVTAQRLDTMTRTDFIALCTAKFIEAVGVRFSLIPMLEGLEELRGVLDLRARAKSRAQAGAETDPVIHLGFDQQLGCAWAGRVAQDNAWTRWHLDASLQMHSSTPYQQEPLQQGVVA